MKKKLVSLLVAASVLCSSFAGAVSVMAEDGDALSDGTAAEEPVFDGNIRVWMPGQVADLTTRRVASFQTTYPEFADYNISVEAVNEEDAARRMIADPAGGADLFCFTQDQIGRLDAAGALAPAEDASSWIREQNDVGSVYSASIGDTICAYPVSSDSGYVLYYDRSVVTDVSTVEGILSDLEPTGKKFYMELGSGVYQAAYIFATGCDIFYDTDAAGNFTGADVTCASPFGLDALKGMIQTADMSAFVNGSSVADAANCAAIVAGTRDSEAAMELFGENFACAKLPTFSVGDIDYQMSGFGGFRFLGLKPQENDEKKAVLRVLAQYLTGEMAQLERYEAAGWGPSNRVTANNESVMNDITTTALLEQLQYTVPLRQYPAEFWNLSASLGEMIVSGALKGATDSELNAVLQEFQNSCLSLVTKQ